jgi:hypothetical protein
VITLKTGDETAAAAATTTKRPLSPTSTLSSLSDRDDLPISTSRESNKRVKTRHREAESDGSQATSQVSVATADQVKSRNVQTGDTVPQSTKMSSDGEDFDDFQYEDDTGFDEDVNMGGESLVLWDAVLELSCSS